MTPSSNPHTTQAQSIDSLFAGFGAESAAPASSFPQTSLPAGLPNAVEEGGSGDSEPSASAGPTSSPPRLEGQADLQAAYEWLQAEKQRLEEYTRNQFARIHQQHQALLTKHMQSEQVLATRAQEVNREMYFLTAQAEALRQRGQELAAREQQLAAQMAELAKAQTELLSIQQTSQNIQRDTEAQRAVLSELQGRTAQLQKTEVAARTQFESVERDLHARRQAWEKKQAEIAARQAEVEKRYLAVDKAEEVALHRLQELEEYERRLAQEFDERERRLARERGELEQLRASLRPPVSAEERVRSLYRPASRGVPLRKHG